MGRRWSEEAAPRRSRGGGAARPSPISSVELEVARLGPTAMLEVEEGVTRSGRGNAEAEEARRCGAELRR